MRTYRRLMGFLRPYRRQLWGSLAFAWAAIGMTVLIPLLTGHAVNAIKDGNKADLLPLALAIVGASILRLGLTVVRRLVAGKVSLAVEFDLRQTFYAHLQRLDLGFFDSQQTGQLMSRATVDLQSIRFFLGYGLIFITQSLLTIVLASAVMLALNPVLALIALAPAPFVVYTASRYNRVSRPALQEVQQRIAELTAEAEENVSGIRIVKAFAREEHQLHRFQRAVARVFDQSIYSTRLQAFYSPLIGLLPQFGIALVLLVGGREVINGSLSLGSFSAFYLYVGMLAGPMRMLGVAMGMSQRAIASGNRMFEIIDREPAIQSPPGAPALPAGGGEVELRGVTLRYDGARASDIDHTQVGSRSAAALTGVDLRVEAGRTVALVGPLGAGKTSLVALIARLYDPTRGRCWSTAPTSARSTSTRCARRSPSSPTTASSSPPASPRTSPTRARTRAARRSKRRRGGPRPTASSASSPPATTPASASAASPSPAVSASGSRSPAPCSPTRAS